MMVTDSVRSIGQQQLRETLLVLQFIKAKSEAIVGTWLPGSGQVRFRFRNTDAFPGIDVLRFADRQLLVSPWVTHVNNPVLAKLLKPLITPSEQWW